MRKTAMVFIAYILRDADFNVLISRYYLLGNEECEKAPRFDNDAI